MKVPLVDSPGTVVLPNPAGRALSVLSVEQAVYDQLRSQSGRKGLGHIKVSITRKDH